jgi:CBS domain-containing protein
VLEKREGTKVDEFQAADIFVEQVLPCARLQLFTVRSDARAIEAAELLANPKASLVLVCDRAGSLTGVLSRTDIVRHLAHAGWDAQELAVQEIMTEPVICCTPNQTLQSVWAVMKSTDLRSVPVVDERRRPLGTLIARDVVAALLNEAALEQELLRDYVLGIGYQ